MNQFLQSLQHCLSGRINFNLGVKRAFLYGKYWYPLRATINHARSLDNQIDELTTDRALVELAYFLPYIRIADIEFTSQYPVEIDESKVLDEIRHLSNKLNQIL
ncbi:MAG: hypothetical protein ACK4EY_16325 [Flavipsychrobacter sp.]